jgi:putative endonuclease
MSRQFYIYILSNYKRTVLYIGVTNNLETRVWQHKQNLVKGFTQTYQVHDLLYYEQYTTPLEAIDREKQIKSWSRKRKEELIKITNPEMKDLYPSLLE